MAVDWAVTTLIVLAALPVALGLINLLFYRPLGKAIGLLPAVSVLVPARNEAERIAPVIDALLQSEGVDFEVVIGDDSSTDATPEIVREVAARDERVRLVTTPAMPDGWSGKMHACHALSQQARHELAVFLDADVVVTPDALARIVSYLQRHDRVGLMSGFPRQLTGTFWEKLVIPLIHVLLLGYLPLIGARLSNHPMFGAGCGQLFAVRMDAYRRAGGHAAIADSKHDGVKLPRVFRRHGIATVLFDANAIAATRMYDNPRDLWLGLSKNAHEAMATPVGLPIWTVLLIGGHVLPVFALAVAILAGTSGDVVRALALAAVLSFTLRAVLAIRFQQSALGVLLHPIGMIYLVYLQWVALIRRARGQSVVWRDRSYGGR